MSDLIKIPRKAPLFVLVGLLVANISTAAVVAIDNRDNMLINEQYVVYAEESEQDDTVDIYETQQSQPVLTQQEIELIAVLTMAEAEGEDEMGKRLVIDTVLNRVESEARYCPDTVVDVIYQTNAFEPVWNGRMDRCYVTDDILKLVYEELEHRTNYEVVYFTAGEYNPYGTPMFQHGNHYFSGH